MKVTCVIISAVTVFLGLVFSKQKLPKVNKELAMKLMEESELPNKKRKKKSKVGHVSFTHFHNINIPDKSFKSFLSHNTLFQIVLPSLCLPKAVENVLMDNRFKVMFENPDYQVDERSEEFRLLNPIVSKVGERRKKKLSQLVQQEEQVHNNSITTSCAAPEPDHCPRMLPNIRS